ncbi:MAG: hypothetical protein RLZZ371_896 [Pseudomonadota bacterium]
MTQTIIQQLADFTADATFDTLPPEVVHECKRVLLDSIGCAVAAVDELKGSAGIAYGRILGAGDPQATIMGATGKVSVAGAAFANGELISALDMDVVLPPGHVSPYVVPAALAMAESLGSSGRDLITALAVAHDMSNRFGKAMDSMRQMKDGRLSPPPVFGYSSTIFGATAALGKLRGHTSGMLANALAIAGGNSPANPQIAWFQHSPSSTVKHLMAGALAQQALISSYMGELGHRGDLQLIDDAEYGYRRFIGTTKWEPEHITRNLGSVWNFPAESSYKPYPHCRVVHVMFDCIIKLMQQHGLRPNEIESMLVYVEELAIRPVWLNREIGHVHDAQFSMAHGMAMAAHGFPLGKEWQDPKNVFSPSVMALMDRVQIELHPDHAKPGTRPAHVEIRARGQNFVEEKLYAKGSPSPDPSTYMTDVEMIEKFRHNCAGVLPEEQVDGLIDALMQLDQVTDVSAVMRLAARP